MHLCVCVCVLCRGDSLSLERTGDVSFVGFQTTIAGITYSRATTVIQGEGRHHQANGSHWSYSLPTKKKTQRNTTQDKTLAIRIAQRKTTAQNWAKGREEGTCRRPQQLSLAAITGGPASHHIVIAATAAVAAAPKHNNDDNINSDLHTTYPTRPWRNDEAERR